MAIDDDEPSAPSQLDAPVTEIGCQTPPVTRGRSLIHWGLFYDQYSFDYFEIAWGYFYVILQTVSAILC